MQIKHTLVRSNVVPRKPAVLFVSNTSQKLPQHLPCQAMRTEVSFPQDNQHIVAAWEAKRIYGNVRRCTNLPLPPIREALSLLQEYFDSFNCVFPLFHQAS